MWLKISLTIRGMIPESCKEWKNQIGGLPSKLKRFFYTSRTQASIKPIVGDWIDKLEWKIIKLEAHSTAKAEKIKVKNKAASDWIFQLENTLYLANNYMGSE